MHKLAIIGAAAVLLLPLAMNADVPDVATGDFWYTEGRASYPGATAAAVATAVVATVPQVSGEPAFDSGVGDAFNFVLTTEFLTFPNGFIIFVY